MIVVGARGHAVDILQVLESSNAVLDNLFFYDDINPNTPAYLFGRYKVLTSPEQAREMLNTDNRVVLGIGGGKLRERIAQQFMQWGGKLHSVIANSASIGQYENDLADGLNIMDGVLITNQVVVGEGSLLNARATLHHNVQVGRYCEISPGVQLLGNAHVGDFCQIGAGAIIMPHVHVGNGAVVGAGAVVNKSVQANTLVVGVPARFIRFL